MQIKICEKKQLFPHNAIAWKFRSGLWLIFIFCMSAPVYSSETQSASKIQWYCSLRESEGIVKIEVWVNDNLVNKSQVSYCQKKENLERLPITRHIIRFQFIDKNLIFSEKESLIEGNIWQAGHEAASILLGISFSSDKRVEINTIHPVILGRENVSSPIDGLIIKTRTDGAKPTNANESGNRGNGVRSHNAHMVRSAVRVADGHGDRGITTSLPGGQLRPRVCGGRDRCAV